MLLDPILVMQGKNLGLCGTKKGLISWLPSSHLNFIDSDNDTNKLNNAKEKNLWPSKSSMGYRLP